MNNLAKIQAEFQNYILNFENGIQDNIISTNEVNAQDRIDIYANAYRYRLIDVLFDDYEKLSVLLGDEEFNNCANSYIDIYPSNNRSIRWFGQNLSRFLKKNKPYSDLKFLSEIAEFEWNLMSTFDAPDNDCITIDSLRHISPEKWGQLTFKFTSSLKKLQFKWNTLNLWKSINENTIPVEPEKLEHIQTCIVWRQNMETNYRMLSLPESVAINYAVNGKSFCSICEILCDYMDEDKVSFTVANYLKSWVMDGLIISVES
tara:strand:- start:6317 stop:7096 length:780 start_codon:yes stop_codon:yes gene_type:complete